MCCADCVSMYVLVDVGGLKPGIQYWFKCALTEHLAFGP